MSPLFKQVLWMLLFIFILVAGYLTLWEVLVPKKPEVILGQNAHWTCEDFYGEGCNKTYSL